MDSAAVSDSESSFIGNSGGDIGVNSYSVSSNVESLITDFPSVSRSNDPKSRIEEEQLQTIMQLQHEKHLIGI